MAGVSPKSRGPLPGPLVPGSQSVAQGVLAVGCPTDDWGPVQILGGVFQHEDLGEADLDEHK